MKKLFFALMAVVAISFASCSSNGNAGAEVTEQLEQALNSGDANSFKDKLTVIVDKVKSLVTENPEQAKEYLAKAQEFLKANAEKVTALVGNNATIAGLVNAVTEAKPDDVISGLFGSAVEKAQNAATDVQDAVQDAAQQQIDAVEGAVQEQVNAAQETVEGAVQEQVDQVKQKVNDGIDNIAGQIKL